MMMNQQSVRSSARSLALAVVLAVMVPHATAILLPIVPLPISFNFGGSSPMSMDVPCSLGTLVEVDGAKQVRQGCGPARFSWKVIQESGQGAGSEIPLGNLASQQKLALTLAPSNSRGTPGALPASGTYLVQLTISYGRCSAEQGQTRVNVGPCASSDEGTSTQSYELQSCKELSEPGKRKLILKSQGGSTPRSISWQVVPQQGSSSVSTEAGTAALSCSSGNGQPCVLFVGSGSGKVNPGRSYGIKYNTGAQAPAPAQATAEAKGTSGLGINLGLGSFGFGRKMLSTTQSGSGTWRDLQGVQVDKCPPVITRSAAAVMGTCGGSRWLEMQVSAVDMEEGPSAGHLKFYWYVLSARTQDVVREASGPLVKLEVGQGPDKIPDGRRYLVNLVVTTTAGGVSASTKETVSGVLDVPAC